MNCKPGDLAIVIRSARGKTIGKIVRCIRLSRHYGLRQPDGSIIYGPVWETDTKGVSVDHTLRLDACLRPIRDPGDDATDESLLWKPSPVWECDWERA